MALPVRRAVLLSTLALLAVVGAACTGSSSSPSLPPEDDACAGPCPASNIKHVVVVIQENHTFDDHFGG